jgi:hypothetical protein
LSPLFDVAMSIKSDVFTKTGGFTVVPKHLPQTAWPRFRSPTPPMKCVEKPSSNLMEMMLTRLFKSVPICRCNSLGRRRQNFFYGKPVIAINTATYPGMP